MDAKDKKGWTSLHHAAFKGHEPMVKALLNEGAAARAICDEGWTPLSYANSRGHSDIVKVLTASSNYSDDFDCRRVAKPNTDTQSVFGQCPSRR